MDKLFYSNINRLFAYNIVDQLFKHGVSSFYSSPGLRNAPLLWALENHVGAKKISFSSIDERSSGFRALGNSKAKKNTAVLICTSGTAISNYLPAIIEASKSKNSLLIISADRPKFMSIACTNQTIDHSIVLANYTKYFIDLDVNESLSPIRLASIIASLIQKNEKKHITHLNLRFDEPLDNSIDLISENYFSDFNILTNDINPYKRIVLDFKKETLLLENIIKKFKNPLIVIGELNQKININNICKLGCFFHADITSNIKFDVEGLPNHLPSPDHPEVLNIWKQSNFDLIIHLGGRTTSKYYYRFLIEENPYLISIHDMTDPINPSLTERVYIKNDPNFFIDWLSKSFKFKKREKNLSILINKKEKLIESEGLSYPYITKRFIEITKNKINLIIGNSTIIRSFNSYTSSERINTSINTFVNRGVSGIEGFISMSLGVVESFTKPTVLFLGDISFLHDLNAISLLSDKKLPLLLIIINNHQGGIFNLLPISNEDNNFIKKLTTPHNFSFKGVCESFNVNYKSVSDKSEFNDAINSFYKKSILTLVEVDINDKLNTNLYKKLKTITYEN